MKQVPDSLPIVTAGCGSGWPLVQGICPACGSRSSLFLGSGGYVTCAVIRCPDPTAVADRLLTACLPGVSQIDAQARIADLTDTCDILRTQNSRLQRELDAARGQRDDARAQANAGRMAP